MPKKRPLPDIQEDRNFVAVVQSSRIKNGLSEADLAISLHMSMDTLSKRLKDPNTFTLRELRILKKRLKMDVVI